MPSTNTTTYMWNYPLDAHENWARAEAEKTSLQQTLGLEITGSEANFIPTSTQVAVTDREFSFLSQLFGTHLKKDGASIDEPMYYHTRLLGTIQNPWQILFGVGTHLEQQQQLLKSFSREQALLQESATSPPEEAASSAQISHLNDDAAKLITLIDQAIGPRQELLQYVQNQIGRIRQA
jgi:hypothetical protein